MGKMYYDRDCDAGLSGKKVAVIGYGSQGRAQALNLRDSGADVVIGLYDGSKSAETARVDGFYVTDTAGAVGRADIAVLLVNDEKMKSIYDESVASGLKAGMALCFAHGFNIRYGRIDPPDGVDVVMVAPKGPGRMVRDQYLAGMGVPCLVAVERDATGGAKALALAYASAIGGGRAGILETTFKEETETDLFGEQCVLCGGVAALMKAGFETLVEAGYQPESAYFECVHEMKLIVDLIAEGGFSHMRASVSDTAEYGDYSVGDRIITQTVKDEMKKALDEIQDGSFARRWLVENANGRPSFTAKRAAERELPVEKVGAELRRSMAWK